MTRKANRNYYKESKRLKSEAMAEAEKLSGNPMVFNIENGFSMTVEISRSDIKTITSKNTEDDMFNAIKNVLAKDIKGYIKKSSYMGWRKSTDGKHEEAAYFVYYNRSLGTNTYLELRKMNETGHFKPYAIIDQRRFAYIKRFIIKGKPPQ